MNFQGLIACAALLAMASFYIGRLYERNFGRRISSAAARRIKEKYQAVKGSTERI